MEEIKNRLIAILEQIFPIYSPSGGERGMSDFCMRFLRNCGWDATQDSLGNVMAHRGAGSLPLLNAHLDTVQDETDLPCLHAIRYDAMKDEFRLAGIQIGADDKAGVGIILCLARHTNLPFKIVLTVNEECGQTGIRAVPENFYRDVCWAFTLDRSQGTDVITRYRDRNMCSEAFLARLRDLARCSGVAIEPAEGSMADTYHIARYVSAVNLSCGYYGAHRKNDSLRVGEAHRIMMMVRNCVKNARKLTGI